jgi:transposase
MSYFFGAGMTPSRWLDHASTRPRPVHLDTLTRQATPTLRAQPGVGPDTAAKLLITAGDNPHRIHSEAAFAHLCGAAPIPASSGRTDKHRLNRGGDRHANNALHTITLTRQRHDPRTRAYTQRRTSQGLTPRDIRRCLKRYIARELHPILIADLTTLTT